MPRVSVIIPAHNAEEHLGQTLSSVAAQSYRDWEVVVSDDASTDRTREIAEGYDGVSVLRSDRTLGPASARNTAVEHSTGELLAFLDSDDYWMDDYLERQVALYDESESVEPGVGVVACNARILGPAGFLDRTYVEYVGSPHRIGLSRLLVSNPIFVSALTTRAVFDEAGGFCPDLFGTEDHDLWIRIVELGYRVVASDRALAVYRLGAGSVSANLARMADNEQRVYRRALDRHKLTDSERRVAQRQLRRRQAIETMLTARKRSLWHLLGALPLLVRVAAENPGSWPSIPRLLTRGAGAFSGRFE